MEKSRIKLIHSGKGLRMDFSRKKEVLEMPNLIEVQRNSYQWFLDEGLKEAFNDVMPIEDRSGDYRLEYVSHRICDDEIQHSVEECKQIGINYEVPLKVTLRLVSKADDPSEITEIMDEIFMGNLPKMTDTGTFIINGAERVIVSQLVRSPGAYFTIADKDKDGVMKLNYSSQVIPIRGAWLEYATDDDGHLWVNVDRQKKLPVTQFLRALGISRDQDIRDLFGENDENLNMTIDKDNNELAKKLLGADSASKDKFEKKLEEITEQGLNNQRYGLEFLYTKLKPGDPFSEENAASLLNGMLFDPKKYDLAKVGRYKFNKKLALRTRVSGSTLAKDVIDPTTGEVMYEAGTMITPEIADDIQYAAVPSIDVNTSYSEQEIMADKDKRGVSAVARVLSNKEVDIRRWVNIPEEELKELGITEEVYYPVLKPILEEFGDDEAKLKKALKNNLSELIPKHITLDDILVSVNYILDLKYRIGNFDDIDHLGNRRIRSVGELLQNQYRVGLTRLERMVREKMQTIDPDDVKIQSLVNIKPVTGAIKEFFGSSQLSQFMDQNNPLSELTHKRRLSALGPGGLSRERAGFQVRDVHYTHYGRMCPIETPEGPNIGLINSLANFARINQYGFIEAPYLKCDKSDPRNPRVTDEVVYLSADEEDNYVVAQGNEPVDDEGYFVNDEVSGRFRENIAAYPKSRIDLMDVSPRMVFSVATSMIPFLQNDDANRALMGSNMQRQAVPLMITEGAVVCTGMEKKAAIDSGVCILAKRDGVVEIASATEIVIRPDVVDPDLPPKDVYHLIKFSRSNQGNCMNQRCIVYHGDHVKKGDVIADGPSTSHGEIALGKNPLIGFMTWEGYNYEDAVLMSERMVQDDVYTSIHIEKYTCESRDTKLGPEEITKDIGGLGEDVLKDLDDDGIVRIGAEVRAGDILVGKVTPKGETELSPEEKLIRAIFGEKAREVRDTSLRVPHGAYGVVMSTQTFTRENKDQLGAGVNEAVNVYIAQKRKIGVGDKMAGRHGNKGVISRVLPVEDMPFLPNGRPLDIVLNPLGVPSRMNIGQVMELHLGLASKVLGINASTPIFNGANEEDVMELLEMANDYANKSWDEFVEIWGDQVNDDMLDYLHEHLDHRAEWKGVPIDRTGKVQLRDGRTGEKFDRKVAIGFMHYLKLHHLVDDKIHARSTGPYSLVTQQPLGGKAQFGGQRFGEMEVWALEAYGAAYTLQEILTVKSDDVGGRVKTYESIIKGENIQEPGVPESFKVLLKEFQSLALDITVLDENGNEVDLREDEDYTTRNPEVVSLINDRDSERDASAHEAATAGLTVGEAVEGEQGGLEVTETEETSGLVEDLADSSEDDE